MRSDSASASVLRWYPAAWRDRYGDELVAMIEDDLSGRPPSIRYRLSIAQSGLNERLRAAGMVGNSVPASQRIRGGALTVLCAFALFVVPGVGFAKISEHWDESIHRGLRHIPAVSLDLLASLAVACTAAVVIAAVTVFPTFLQFVRTGGWATIRRRVGWALTASLVIAALGGGLVLWATHLTSHERNAEFGWYQFVFVMAAIMVAVTIATWTAAAVAITRRLSLGVGQIRVLGVLAVAVAVCMPTMTAAAAVWWGSMATNAPWFLAGTPVGSSPSPLSPNLLAVLIVMMIGSGAGVVGSFRVIRSWTLLPSV